jgi:tetratricopeptide (TPR) repeat protein
MPSNSKIITALFIGFTLFGCSASNNTLVPSTKLQTTTKVIKPKVVNKEEFEENVLLSLALDYEFNKQYKNSAMVYEKLYKKNPNYDYFQKLLYLHAYNKEFTKLKELSQEGLVKYPSKKEYLLKNYVFSLIKLKQYNEALKYSKQLVSIKKSANNYSFLADSYYGLKDYKNASKYYLKSYKLNKNTKAMINYTNILFNNLNKKTKAIKFLENYTKNRCIKDVCTVLLSYYERTNNIQKTINLSKKMLKNYKSTYSEDKISQIQNYILTLYLKIDIKKAIKYLEEEGFDDKKLAFLYSITNQNKKALDLYRKIYKQTQDITVLGQIAMLESEYDKSVSKQDIYNKFEKTLKYKPNPIYQNYYGYLLLNDNAQLKKALELIKKAYNSNPNNLAFKDSLAYAYFKNKQYKKAYTLMEDVVSKVGLSNIEIKQHWEEIKKYKDNK